MLHLISFSLVCVRSVISDSFLLHGLQPTKLLLQIWSSVRPQVLALVQSFSFTQISHFIYTYLHMCVHSSQRRQWHPTLVLLPGKSHGWRGLVGCSSWGHQESDTTERLHFHFSLSCIGEGNGNPLQCSCLENPRDRAAWWAAVYGVAQSRTRPKRLSSSSSSTMY